MNALKSLEWFPGCVRDIRAFKVEHWSDFTDFMKS
jgi:virulence-associated protein VapD